MRGRFASALPISLAIGILVFGAVPGVALAQGITVRGTVVERAQESWVGGATVRLSDLPPYFTDLDGRFRFSGVTPGRHTLTVEAMGYETRWLELVISADTAIVVEMDPDPIVLDSLLVRVGSITIRGEILAAEDGQRVLHAQVTVLPGFPTTGAISGFFTIHNVPGGRAVTVLVESVGYLPARIALITEADTTLTVELEPDPVGLRMLANQVEKLEVRSRGIPFPRRVFGQEELGRYPGWPVHDIVDTQLALFGRRALRLSNRSTHPCLFVDDVQLMHSAFLWGLMAGEVERVEIYDRGRMIRVYTKRFLVRTLGKEPGPIVYMKIGVGGVPICR